jgi:poly-gamma-glutamate capsule biosynthesis protein CapA/YwtB (metallophosphatase superfamily)
MTSSKDVKDIFTDGETYYFQKVVEMLAGKNATPERINSVEKSLKAAVVDKKLKANLAYRVKQFKDGLLILLGLGNTDG